MSNFAHVGEFCRYLACSDCGKTDQGNLIRFGKTRQGKQRFRCKSSLHGAKGFKEAPSSFGCARPPRTPKPSKSACSRTTASSGGNAMRSGVMSATKAKKHYREAEASGPFWRATMIEPDTRQRVARGIAKTETEAFIWMVKALREETKEDPPRRWLPGWVTIVGLSKNS